VADAYLLDTSAVLAYLEAEEGYLRVRELLRTEKVLLPFAAVLEVCYVTTRKQGDTVSQERHAGLKALPCLWLNTVAEATLLTAARIKARHQLSFADALVGGFAISQNAILVHKDPEFEPLVAEVRQERLPYKPRGQAP
jgi:predicted nucleic acid-binding protein